MFWDTIANLQVVPFSLRAEPSKPTTDTSYVTIVFWELLAALLLLNITFLKHLKRIYTESVGMFTI